MRFPSFVLIGGNSLMKMTTQSLSHCRISCSKFSDRILWGCCSWRYCQ